jgi:hypothetical protein
MNIVRPNDDLPTRIALLDQPTQIASAQHIATIPSFIEKRTSGGAGRTIGSLTLVDIQVPTATSLDHAFHEGDFSTSMHLLEARAMFAHHCEQITGSPL